MRKIYIFLFILLLTKTFPQSGELDTTFAASGFFISDDENLDTGHCIFVLPDDKIIMGGGYDNFTALKLLPNGSYDTSFGTDGKLIINFEGYNASVNDIVVQPDGKIIMAGHIFINGGNYYYAVIRLNSDGSLDTTFNGTGKLTFDFNDDKNYLYKAALQPDGKIVVAGSVGNLGSSDFAVARINPNGTLDTTFGTNGKREINVLGDDFGKSVKIQPDGKILICGYSYPSGNCSFAVVRLTISGDLDPTFSGDGIATTKVASSFGNDTVQDMALQADGKIVVLADSYIVNHQIIGVIRLTTAGELDPSFSGDGKFSGTMYNTTDYPDSILIQPDGKILIASNFRIPNVEQHLGLMRLTSAGDLDTTFSQDGKADFVVPLDNGCEVYDMKLQSTGQILVGGYALNDFMLARIFSGNELGLPEYNTDSVLFYPNPASQVIQFHDEVVEAGIYLLDGKLLVTQKATTGPMDISGLPESIYLVKTKTKNGNVTTHKLAVMR